MKKAAPRRGRCSVSRNSTRCKRGNSRARLRLTRLFPLLKTPSTKFYGKLRIRSTAPRTQFAVKFPCRCLRRRRMSADGDVFILFYSLKRPRAGAALLIMERCSQCAFGPAFVIAQRPGQRVQQRTVNLAAAGNKAVLHFLGCQRVRHDQLQAENIGQPFVPD